MSAIILALFGMIIASSHPDEIVLKIKKRLTIKNALKAVVACVVFVAVLCLLGLRFNLTASYPVGFWFQSSNVPAKGDLIFVCPPDNPISKEALERGYFERGICPGGYKVLIKRLVGTAGDEITVDNGTIYINGTEEGKIKEQDGSGRPLKPFTSRYRLASDEIWLMSDYDDYSFDSRYFGPVPGHSIKGVAKPILIW